MNKVWIASLALTLSLSTAALAQTQTQNTSSGSESKTGKRNTSSTEGLQRKGGENVGTRGSQKMKDGVSRSGNSNLSPTSPTNAAGPGTNGKSAGGNASGGSVSNNTPTSSPAEGGTVKKPTRSTKPVQQGTKSTGSTRNGNVGNGGSRPMYTQGSTSQGSASVPSNGGAPGTRTVETRTQKPKSRAAMLEKNDTQSGDKATAAGQANSGKKTGSNGAASQGGSNQSLTTRGQQEGSYSDASKRNKTPEGPSKDPLKTGPNGQQTKNQK